MNFNNLREKKGAIIMVVIIILLFIYFKFYSGSSVREKTKNRKLKNRKTKKMAQRKKKTKPQKKKTTMSKLTSMFAEDSSEDSEESDIGEDDVEDKAQKIYNMIHDEMLMDIQVEEFKRITGLDDMVFVEIKQLYTNAMDDGEDPNFITAEHYKDILELD